MIKNYFFFFALFTFLSFNAQSNYNGNGNSGFGGVVGPSTLSIDDDGTTITFTLTKGPADFNDALVLYISTGAAGRTVIDGDVNDVQDGLRRAISNSDPSNSTIINFPTGFEATHAIAVDTNFGGLWSIPNTGVIGNDGLNFVNSANSTLVNSTDASFTFNITWADLGLASGTSFDFVGVYLNAGNAFTSDEGYGTGLPTGNPGGGTVTFTGFETYSNTLSTSESQLETIKTFVNNKQLSFSNNDNPINVSVYNILGQNVYSKIIAPNSEVNLSNQPSGIYIVKLNIKNSTRTVKILLD